jgi:hypothetical protein
MQENSLKIGNLVLFDGKPAIVQGVMECMVMVNDVWYPSDLISPIPITKNDFLALGGIECHGDEYDYLEIDTPFGLLIFEDEETIYFDPSGAAFRFVHEIQNFLNCIT